MKNISEYIKKYPMFCGGILLFLVLFIFTMVKGIYGTGIMIIPLLLTYIFWLITTAERDEGWELLEKVANRYQDLVAKYNNLVDDYNKLADAYKDLESQVTDSTVEVHMVDDNVDDQTES